ncbi:MAG: MdtA/MuxA family multidrug efflux RND transporter periplasmic adaptor subunit [Acidobacteria bacterium]|nr:MdtA/MuxA family multidrug efflux RND transporter periplasmic adaptor subunit [Acidobacteriota bacterium]
MTSHEIDTRAESVPAPPRRRRGGLGLLWLAALALAGYYGYRYYQAGQAKQAAAEEKQAERAAHRAVPVSGTTARRGDLPVYLRGLGTVTPYNTVNVKSRVDGPIVKVNFQEGQNVRAGDVLVEIDPRPYQVQLEQAQGQLARDEAQLKDAQTNLGRYQALWKAQVIAKQQLDTQGAQVGQFEGMIAVDQANIDNAKLNLSFTKVTAPIAGRIGLRQVDIGNIVHASDPNPLAIITQIQPIAVLFTIPADSLPPVLTKLHAGATLPVEAYDRADVVRIASGTLETADNQIDSSTGTSRLKAIFQNEDGVLFPQQFVNCRLLLETRRGVVLVPAAAVQRGPQGSYVYVVKDGTAAMRAVETGITESGEMEITRGLAAGEAVVTDGQDKLQEGSRVDLRPAAAAPDAPGTASEAPASPAVSNPALPAAPDGRGARGSGREGRKR